MKKILWVVASGSMVLSLVLAACGPAAPTTPTTPATPTAPITPTTPTKPVEEKAQKEAVAPAAEAPKYGEVFNIIGGDPTSFDEAYFHFSGVSASFLTHDMLLHGDWTKGKAGTGETDWQFGILGYRIDLLTGGLAESWERPDDQTIIFNVRKGVRYALDPANEASRLVGGREVTAEDVVFNIKRNFEAPLSRLYTGFTTLGWAPTSYKALDKYRVELKLPQFLLIEISQFMWIRPPEVVAKWGDHKNWRNSVGTGPFMLTGYVPGSSLTYVRNPTYWKRDPIGPGKDNQLPYLDGVKALILPDASTRLAAFRTGKIDLLSDISWEDFGPLVKAKPQLKYNSTLSALTLAGRLDKPELPFKDIRVRQALSMAIDREAILRDYYGGRGYIYSYYLPIADHAPFYEPLEKMPQSVQELWQYHPDKAKQLLKEAGYPNGFKTNVVVTAAGVDFMAIVKDYFLKVGVDMEIKVMDSGPYSVMARGRAHEQMITRGAGNYSFPARLLMYTIENVDNLAMWDSPVTKKAFEDIKQHLAGQNYAEISRILRELTPYHLEQTPYIYFPAVESYRIWWPWVKNYYGEVGLGNFGPNTYIQYMWYDQGLKKSMGY